MAKLTIEQKARFKKLKEEKEAKQELLSSEKRYPIRTNWPIKSRFINRY